MKEVIKATNRQYQTLRIEELEAIAIQSWDTLESLPTIVQELAFRSTKRAIGLKRKVEERMAELEKEHSPGGTAQPEMTETEQLFVRVGLHPSAPEFLVNAARTAYRRHYHPDQHPLDKKGEAEKKFKEIENIFEHIEVLRAS